MSDIQFECPKCGHSLIVDSQGAGMSVACPDCHEQITLPDLSPPVADKQATPGLFKRIVAYLILPTLLLAPIALVVIPFIYLVMIEPMPNVIPGLETLYSVYFMMAVFVFMGASVLYFFGQFFILPYLLFFNKSWSGNLFVRGLCYQSALLTVCSVISMSICRILFR